MTYLLHVGQVGGSVRSDDGSLMLGRSLSVRPVAHPCDYLTAYDLAEIAAWAEAARQFGIACAAVHDGFPPGLVSDLNYVVIHEDGQALPSYGLARRADGYHLWRMSGGSGLGVFSTLADVLRRAVPTLDEAEA